MEDTKTNRRKFIAATLAAASVPLAKAQTKNKRSFGGKTAFITGGARGIGLATAKMYAKNGANIVIFDIAKEKIPGVGYPLSDEKQLNLAQDSIKALGVNCLVIKGDVRKLEDLTKAIDATVKKFKSIDFVICNAGVGYVGDLTEPTPLETQTLLAINLQGTINTIQAATPILQKQKSGRIVCVSSILGRQGYKKAGIYSASKWGVIGYAKSTAHALGDFGVTCNVVCPGLVKTDMINNKYMLRKISPHSPNWTTIERMAKKRNVLNISAYMPSDIAQMIKFLSEREAKYITGEVLDIAMGATAFSAV